MHWDKELIIVCATILVVAFLFTRSCDRYNDGEKRAEFACIQAKGYWKNTPGGPWGYCEPRP